MGDSFFLLFIFLLLYMREGNGTRENRTRYFVALMGKSRVFFLVFLVVVVIFTNPNS